MSKLIAGSRITSDSTVATETLGAITQGGGSDEGKTYRYVQVVDLAVENGDVVTIASNINPNIVSKDVSGGSAIGSVAVGVAVGDIAVNSYGWVQIRGLHGAVKSDGSVVAGQAVMPSTSTDGTADTMGGGSEHLAFGFAIADDTTTALVDLRL